MGMTMAWSMCRAAWHDPPLYPANQRPDDHSALVADMIVGNITLACRQNKSDMSLVGLMVLLTSIRSDLFSIRCSTFQTLSGHCLYHKPRWCTRAPTAPRANVLTSFR